MNQQVLDADAIFMYKTIEANYKNVSIVTELAQMSAVAFMINENTDVLQQTGYYASKPFAAGEIFVGSLLNSLMCQAYYNPKIVDIIDQMIMGSANTSAEIMKIYKAMNLSISSLNLVEIPRGCDSLIFSNVFEYCVKNRNMVPVGVYKRHTDDGPSSAAGGQGSDQTPLGTNGANNGQTAGQTAGTRDFSGIGDPTKNA